MNRKLFGPAAGLAHTLLQQTTNQYHNIFFFYKTIYFGWENIEFLICKIIIIKYYIVVASSNWNMRFRNKLSLTSPSFFPHTQHNASSSCSIFSTLLYPNLKSTTTNMGCATDSSHTLPSYTPFTSCHAHHTSFYLQVCFLLLWL